MLIIVKVRYLLNTVIELKLLGMQVDHQQQPVVLLNVDGDKQLVKLRDLRNLLLLQDSVELVDSLCVVQLRKFWVRVGVEEDQLLTGWRRAFLIPEFDKFDVPVDDLIVQPTLLLIFVRRWIEKS